MTIAACKKGFRNSWSFVYWLVFVRYDAGEEAVKTLVFHSAKWLLSVLCNIIYSVPWALGTLMLRLIQNVHRCFDEKNVVYWVADYERACLCPASIRGHRWWTYTWKSALQKIASLKMLSSNHRKFSKFEQFVVMPLTQLQSATKSKS